MYAFSSIYAFVPQPVSNLITNFTVKSKMSVLENSTSSVDGTDEDDLFVDLFTDHQLKSGAIILYIIGKKRKYVHLPLDCRAWQIQNCSFFRNHLYDHCILPLVQRVPRSISVCDSR